MLMLRCQVDSHIGGGDGSFLLFLSLSLFVSYRLEEERRARGNFHHANMRIDSNGETKRQLLM